MTDNSDDDATIKALFATASHAFSADDSPLFTADEAKILQDEAQKLWSNGHWLRVLLQDHGHLLFDPAVNSTPPSYEQLDEALAAVITSAFRIGGAMWIHNGNRRYIRREATNPGRKGSAKKRTPRDKVLDDHFGMLTDRGLKGAKLQEELHKILAQSGITETKLRKPGLRTVQEWAKNYRLRGSWRPPSK